jgi:uncharacterized repeat protein (TIGR01451 family)
VISLLLNLTNGGTATITATGTAPSGPIQTLTNTSTIAPPPDVVDPAPDNNRDVDVNPTNASADLSITKTSSPNLYVPGGPLTYIVVARNDGPNDVTAAPVQDTVPAAITNVTWSCTASGANSCSQTNGAGNAISLTVTLVSGGTATITATGTAPTGPVQTLSNIASILPPPGIADPDPGDNTDTETNPANAQSDLSITKTSSPNPYAPGGPLTYTMTVWNNGPNDVTNASVVDTVPAAITSVTWTCTATPGSGCGAGSGSGNAITTAINLLNGGTATYTITGTAPVGPVQTLNNTASIAPPPNLVDPIPGNNTDPDVNPTNATADLSVIKTSSPNPYVPGGPLTYTMTVRNNGPSDVTNASVADAVPAPITNVTWTCTASAPNVCSQPNGSGNAINLLVSLASGGTATIAATGIAPVGPVQTLINTATITAPAGVTDQTPTDNTGTNTNPASARADLSIAKASNTPSAQTGTSVTYTITVRNAGPSDATNVQVTDPLPSGLGLLSVAPGQGSCTGGATVTCRLGTIRNGGSVVVTIVAQIVGPGELRNTASITSAEADPSPANNTATAVVSGQAEIKDTGDSDKDEERARRRRQQDERERQEQQNEEIHGNVLAVRCSGTTPPVEGLREDDGQDVPYAIIETIDGKVKLRLHDDARRACTSIRIGDYLEANGEKVHEFLWDIEGVVIRHTFTS